MKKLFPKSPSDSEIEAACLTVAKMDLAPDDIVVLRHPRALSRETADRIREHIGKALNGRKCLVLDDGLDIAILSKAEIERQLGHADDERTGQS